jgi:hypothetical protein
MLPPAKPVADKVEALITELEDHKRRVRQALARQDRAEARDAQSARRQDTRRKIIMGGAVMAEARADTVFAATINAVLQRRVSDPRDRLLLALDMELPFDTPLPSAAEFDAQAAARLDAAGSS